MRKAKHLPRPRRWKISASVGDIAYGALLSDEYLMNTRRITRVFWVRAQFTHGYAMKLLKLTPGQGVVSCSMYTAPLKRKT